MKRYKQKQGEIRSQDNNKRGWLVLIELHVNKLSSLEHNRDCNLSSIFFDKSDCCEPEIYFLFLEILKLLSQLNLVDNKA